MVIPKPKIYYPYLREFCDPEILWKEGLYRRTAREIVQPMSLEFL